MLPPQCFSVVLVFLGWWALLSDEFLPNVVLYTKNHKAQFWSHQTTRSWTTCLLELSWTSWTPTCLLANSKWGYMVCNFFMKSYVLWAACIMWAVDLFSLFRDNLGHGVVSLTNAFLKLTIGGWPPLGGCGCAVLFPSLIMDVMLLCIILITDIVSDLSGWFGLHDPVC